jgi:hypothetical protein
VTEAADQSTIDLLLGRQGAATWVTLASGARLTVYNIAWGYDMGDEYAHVTTNISPKADGASTDVFFTNEIRSISDPASGETLG